jgi:hypothetical protein
MIPTVGDLKSAPMTHRFGDLFNPPGLTNFLGCVQVDFDPVGVRSLNFPPFACSDVNTASLYLDGRFFPATGAAVTHVWYPDRVERTAEVDGLFLKTVTALALGRMAVVVEVEVENRGGAERTVDLMLGLRASVTKAVERWNDAMPPRETEHDAEVDDARGAVLFTAKKSAAVQLQGASPKPDAIRPDGLFYTVRLGAGQAWRLSYVQAVAETAEAAREAYDTLVADVPAELARVRADWNAELRAVFTPGNDRFSGHLPELETTDADIAKVYQMGALGVVYFKRDTPHSVYGRAYDTLMPRYWQSVTFLWDYFLSAPVHAQLDPAVMRKYLDLWMHRDVHSHFGTEYLTGAGAGNWYSVNDFAMVSMAREYVRWTGDRAWLTEPVEGSGRRVIDHLREYAVHWQNYRTESGLADYGGLNNLLECVHTYLHEVASLNAANVFNLRTVAELLALVGEPDDGTMARDAAGILRDLQPLYVEGKGYWKTRFPDGSTREVRHCYDLLTVLNTIPDDLSSTQKAEMVAFFERELRTPTWMFALSPGDMDAMRDVRPDHQWTGAYPAWPPETVRGLYRIGRGDLGFDWLKGQAQFAESVVAPEEGGARKAPPDFPYITDWTCSSNGSWVNVVIESIFGVQPSLGGGLTATPQFGAFDPAAELRNVAHQGTLYHVTRAGARPA